MSGRTRSTAAVLAVVIGGVLISACSPPESEQPMCRPGSPTVLMAESVPSAALVPCVRGLPTGWGFHGFTADERGATFTLERGEAPGGVDEITLRSTCETRGEQQVQSVRPDVRQFLRTSASGATATWTTVFEGGCVLEHVTLGSSRGATDMLDAIHHAIWFLARDALIGSR